MKRLVAFGLACVAAVAVTAAPGPSQPQGPALTTLKATPEQFSAALLAETNRVRQQHGRRALKPMPRLDAAADDQASTNAVHFRASHDSPIGGQATLLDRLTKHRLEPVAYAENVVAQSLGTADEVGSVEQIAARLVSVWMESPGHRDNLLNREMTHFGGSVRLVQGPKAVWYAFGVQVFVRLRSTSRPFR